MKQPIEYHIEFKKALTHILDNGNYVSPRGKLTLESEGPYTMGPIDPLKCLYLSEKRALNFFFLFAENLWYLSGRNDTHFLSYYNKNISSFSEDGIHDGAYGIPFREQLRYVIDTLKRDPDTRQALMTFWRQNPRSTKDVPCTIALHFLIRDGKLNLYVQMRSNDIIWGNNYDVPSFCLLQNFVASCIGMPLGSMYLTANSLHLYEDHFKLAKELLEEDSISGSVPVLSPFSLEANLIDLDAVMYVEYQSRLGNVFSKRSEWHKSKFWTLFEAMFQLKMCVKNNTKQHPYGPTFIDICIDDIRDLCDCKLLAEHLQKRYLKTGI